MALRLHLVELRPQLMAFATSLTLDRAAAEDLVHEAILRALRSRAAPGAMGDLRPWMFRVVRNLFIDMQRRERTVRAFRRDGAPPAVARPGLGDPVEVVLVRQAYARLSPHEREILGLVDIMELKYREAAETLGIPIGTVMSRLSSARRSMLGALGESRVRSMPKRQARDR